MHRLATFLLLAIALCGCDGGIHCQGYVQDLRGKPIPGAKVYLDHELRSRYPELFETTTNAAGTFHLSSTVAPGHYGIPLVVVAVGFTSARLDLPTLTGNKVKVSLAPADSRNQSTILLQ